MASKRPADAPSASIGCHRSLCGSNSGKKRTAPSRSCTLAAVTSSAQIRPRVSTPRWRLRPLTFFQRHSQEFSQVRSALFFRRLHRLAVDNNDGGSGFFTRRKAHLAAQRRTLRRRGAPCGAEELRSSRSGRFHAIDARSPKRSNRPESRGAKAALGRPFAPDTEGH